MELVLTDDQRMLAETARDFVASTKSVARLRRLRDSRDPKGFSPEVWTQMAELGWTGVPFAEADGGLGLGLAEVALIAEALGRELAPEPFVGTVVLAGMSVAKVGTDIQKQSLLAPLIAGTSHAALAYYERGARHDPRHVRTRARRTSAGFCIDGVKDQVLSGPVAEHFIVVARTSGADTAAEGLTLLVVPADRPGVTVTRQWRVDGASVARVEMQGVTVPEDAVLGERDRGHDILSYARDAAMIATAAEMLGGMSAAFEQTLRYLKERTQFGTAIGTFQALKHRAARLFIEIELSRSVVMAAARAFDAGSEDASKLASAAKARASDAYILVANEAIQMHGGIGMTDEHDIGFHLKRARACEQLLGDAAYHRRRFAELAGF